MTIEFTDPAEASSQPAVSVVVPTRNSARTLARCLDSVKQQAFPGVELIVVDNSSTDGSLQIARHYADRVEIHGPERSAQRNLGARVARGRYLLFVDSDMILRPGLVGDCVLRVEAEGAPAVVIPEESTGQGFWSHCRALERSCYEGDDGVEAARFYRRSAFQLADGYDESLTGVEDWDLSRRVAGAKRLPRARQHILHDEGVIHLGPWLAKKRYYGATFRTYLQKQGARALWQANLVARPAFARHWRRLLRHPILTIGMLTLKAFEMSAALYGALWIRPPHGEALYQDESAPK